MGFWDTTGWAVLLGAGASALGQTISSWADRRAATEQFNRDRKAQIAERVAHEQASRLERLAVEIATLDALTLEAYLLMGPVSRARESAAQDELDDEDGEPAAARDTNMTGGTQSVEELKARNTELRAKVEQLEKGNETIDRFSEVLQRVSTQLTLLTLAAAAVVDDDVRAKVESLHEAVSSFVTSSSDRADGHWTVKRARRDAVDAIAQAHRRLAAVESEQATT